MCELFCRSRDRGRSRWNPVWEFGVTVMVWRWGGWRAWLLLGRLPCWRRRAAGRLRECRACPAPDTTSETRRRCRPSFTPAWCLSTFNMMMCRLLNRTVVIVLFYEKMHKSTTSCHIISFFYFGVWYAPLWI